MFSLFNQRSTPTQSSRLVSHRAAPPTQPTPQFNVASAWHAVALARFFFIGTPAPIPARLLAGFFTTSIGTPCRRAVVDGFGVMADIGLDHLTGSPRVI